VLIRSSKEAREFPPIGLIKSVGDQLAQGILSNVDFAKSLADRVATYKTDFDQTNGRIGKTDTCKRIRPLLPGPFARLESVDGTKLTAAADVSSAQDYMDLDGRLFELQIIREYVDLVEGLASTSNLRTKITGHEAELVDFFKPFKLRSGICSDAFAAVTLNRDHAGKRNGRTAVTTGRWSGSRESTRPLGGPHPWPE